MSRKLDRLVRIRQRQSAVAAVRYAEAQRQERELDDALQAVANTVDTLTDRPSVSVLELSATGLSVGYLLPRLRTSQGVVEQRARVLAQAATRETRAETLAERAREDERRDRTRQEQRDQDDLAARGENLRRREVA